MSGRKTLTAVLKDGIPFVGIMVFWIAITAVVYGVFVLVWPPIPEAEPWIHFGVYILPLIGYIGHTVQRALKPGRV